MSDPRTARTRLRLVLGMPTRKIDFQTCELTMPSWTCFRVIYSPRRFDLHLEKGFRVHPVTALLMELHRLVDHDLAVGRIDEDLGPLQRAGRRSFEVDTGPVIAAAVAGA